MRIGRIVLVMALAACGGGKSDKLSAAQVAELEGLLRNAEKVAGELDAARRAGVAEAVAEAEPAAPRDCPAAIVKRRGTMVDNFLRMGAIDLPATKYGEPPPRIEASKGLRGVVVAKKAEKTRTYVAGLGAGQFASLAADFKDLAAPAFWSPYEIDLVIQTIDPPKVHDFQRFSGGVIEGRAVVWSHEKGAVVCWAPVRVTLSAEEEQVEKGATPEDQAKELLSQLYIQADHAAVQALKLEGVPRLPGDAIE